MSFTVPGLDTLRALIDDEDEDLSNVQLDRYLCDLVGVEDRIERMVADGLWRLKNGDHFMKFGYSSLCDYALGRLGIQGRQAQEMVCLENWIQDYPCIDRAWRLGRLSASHVDLLRKAKIALEQDEDWAMQASRFSVRGLEEHLKQDGNLDLSDTAEETYWTWLEVEASPAVRLQWEMANEIFTRMEGRPGQGWEVLEACGAEVTNGPAFITRPSATLMQNLAHNELALKHRQDCRKAWRDHLDNLEGRSHNSLSGDIHGRTLPDFKLPDDADPATIDQQMQEALSLRDHQNLLMRLLAQAHYRSLHSAWGLRTFHAYAQDRLGLSKTTVDRWLHIQYRLWVNPCVDTAWQAHRLNLTQVELLLDVVRDRTVEAWLDYASTVATLQLKRDVDKARTLRREFPDRDILPPSHEDAASVDVSLAELLFFRKPKATSVDGETAPTCSPDAVSSSSGVQNTPMCSPTDKTPSDEGEDATPMSSEGEANGHEETAPMCSPRSLRVGTAPLALPSLSDGVIRMRIPVDVYVYVMQYIRGHLAYTFDPGITMSQVFEVVVAAFLKEYALVARAAAKAHPVCERDHFRCQVPGCSRAANQECHHIWYRSRGGPDAQWNLVTLCARHHRQGIHEGYILLTGRAPDSLVWKLGLRPDGSAYEMYVGTRRTA